jgi:hypothetical protein
LGYFTPDGIWHENEESAKEHFEKNNPGYSRDVTHDGRDGSIGYIDPLGNKKDITYKG